MTRRVRTAAVFVIAMGAVLLAGQPGEKAKGPPFKTDEFTLVWGKLKTWAEVDLGDEKKSKYSIQLDGSMEVPSTGLDVVCVYKKFRIRTVTDEKGGDMTPKLPASTGYVYNAYSAIHDNVGQVELAKIDLPRDATRIGTMVFDTNIIIALKRDEATLPAVVMEDFKDIGHGISVRVTSLQMSNDRQLTVVISYKRAEADTTGPFTEALYALDPAGKEIGGGRWIEGDPFGKTGQWTGRFKIDGSQRHQSFRFVLVTESRSQDLSFTVKDIFGRQAPAAN